MDRKAALPTDFQPLEPRLAELQDPMWYFLGYKAVAPCDSGTRVMLRSHLGLAFQMLTTPTPLSITSSPHVRPNIQLPPRPHQAHTWSLHMSPQPVSSPASSAPQPQT